MVNVFLSVLPIFLLIVAGHVTKKRFVTDEVFWKASDKLVYYLFFPALLILEVSHADFAAATTSTALIATVVATIGVAALIFVGQALVKVKSDLFTSIFQGGVRYNSYVFIALSQSLFGTMGVALAGVFMAYMIVLTNVLSVLVMNHYGEGGKKSIRGMIAALAQNPLIIGAGVGLALNGMGMHITGALRAWMQYLGNAATPLSLMSVGAGLVLAMHRQKVLATLYSVVLKLLLMPACTLAVLKLQGASGTPANVALLYASVPCAGNAYILARQMGGDTEAMASIITWTTLASAASITFILGTIAM